MSDTTENKKNKKTAPPKRDVRIRLLSGISIVIFSLILLLSFISFLISWKFDLSIQDMPLVDLLSTTEPLPSNWMGRVGILLSSLFILKWVGISAFAIVPLLFFTGARILGHSVPLNKIALRLIIPMLFISIFLGYIVNDASLLFNGAHGYFISRWMVSIFGKVGTGFVLTFIAIIVLAYLFEKQFYSLLATTRRFWDRTMSVIERYRQKYREQKEREKEKTEANIDEDSEENNQLGSPDADRNYYPSADGITNNPDNKEQGYQFIVENTQPDEPVEEPIFQQEPIHPEEACENLIQFIESENEPQFDPLELEEQFPKKTDTSVGFLFEQPKEEEAEFDNSQHDHSLGKYDPTLDLSNYQFPTISLLPKVETSTSSVTENELKSNKEKIVETLANYGIKIDTIKATIGPTVTLYEIVPAPGVRISKIKSLENDIALSLAALGIRIIAPMPGKGTIGIEVPNQNPEIVHMRTVLSSKKFQESKYVLPLALGKTITNETFVIDLAKAPHLLVAGATGQGKSVGLNAILVSLLYKKHPAELKLVLVDPKKVELTLYNKLEKHFLAALPNTDEPIITDTTKVINTLNSLTIEMDNRYELLKQAQVRHITEYNEKFINRQLNPLKGHRYMPYIVVVIDEFADLIMTAGKEIELPISRIAQLARAVGIHMIIATQRPTTNIITGLIKANFPARIAFRVTSGIDSKTILDGPGANQLIGRGDMLVLLGSEPVRVQCAFLDTPEVEAIADYIAQQPCYPSYYELPEYVGEESSFDPSSVDLSQRDPLFEEAARLIVIHQQGSTSLIQRKFSIGYNRAGRIIDQLEAAGVVGPFEGSKARQVLIPDELSLEHLLKNIK